MKKWSLLVIAGLVVAMSLTIVAPAGACSEGCTPGYWKQPHHFDSWVGYSPDDDFHDVCNGMLPHITLLEALSAKNKDYPSGEAAFLRHAAAAFLNEAAGLDSMSGSLCGPETPNWVELAYGAGGFEHVKNILEEWNELGCPLD